MARTEVFVSYSHVDSEYLARLKIHLRPFERRGLVELWSDTKIKSGQRWKQEIRSAIDRAAITILLVSADFLASEFIAENELPPLLKAAEAEGVKILPVILKPCAFSEIAEISQFQSVNDPRNPVVSMNEGPREQLWYDVATTVNKELKEFAESAKPLNASGVRVTNFDKPIVMLGPNKEVLFGLFTEELRDPNVIDDFIIYQYEHVDELAYMPLAKDILGDIKGFDATIGRIEKNLKRAGWEGDGEIRLMWLPPFVGAGIDDTWGVGIWFVKQSNNGTSWLASPVPLPFSRLLEQNS
jgi:hypothetical protein